MYQILAWYIGSMVLCCAVHGCMWLVTDGGMVVVCGAVSHTFLHLLWLQLCSDSHRDITCCDTSYIIQWQLFATPIFRLFDDIEWTCQFQDNRVSFTSPAWSDTELNSPQWTGRPTVTLPLSWDTPETLTCSPVSPAPVSDLVTVVTGYPVQGANILIMSSDEPSLQSGTERHLPIMWRTWGIVTCCN